MQSRPLSSFAAEGGRAAQACLAVEFAGGRTILRRQRVSYPMHITRGFYLDAARRDVLTIYLQSASGGLYAGDRLNLDIAVTAGAAIHLTTQAATVVHDGLDAASCQNMHVSIDEGAFCAITADPYILFPGARLLLENTIVVAESAVLFLADGIAAHDPNRAGRVFAEYVGRQRVMRPDGRVLLLDRGRICGDAMRKGPLGAMSASANALIIAPPHKLPAIESLTRAVDACGCLAGVSEAPNEAGLVLRMLAPDGGSLARGIEAAFHVAGRTALGIELARRRK